MKRSYCLWGRLPPDTTAAKPAVLVASVSPSLHREWKFSADDNRQPGSSSRPSPPPPWGLNLQPKRSNHARRLTRFFPVKRSW